MPRSAARSATWLLPALALTLAVVLLPAPPAAAGPVKCEASDTTPDDRVFPEPRNSQTFLRFDEFQCGIELLAATYSDLLEVTILGESFNGHPVYDVVMTDETAPPPDGREEKEKLLVVSSIHGNEVGGREGAARNIEDMLDPRFLADEGWVQQVLDEFAIHWLFPNPDGWVLGDAIGSPGASVAATRGNGNGTDLNRQFPVTGYIANATLSEPESVAVDEGLLQEGGWFLGTDNHGQGPDTYAAAGLQIVGQFDFQKSETLARFADGITESMAEYDGLSSLAALNEATGLDVGPYHWGTLYDMLGYSASGSLIDYYNTPTGTGGTGFATELTVGAEVNLALHGPQLNQLYVDSIRAINYTMFQQAIDRRTYTYPVGGRVGYLFDPEVITDDDEDGAGYEPDTAAGQLDTVVPYEVTRMRFFEDLNLYADRPLTPVRVGEVLDGEVDLATFDSFVIADDQMPEEGDADAWTAALQAFVEEGGNLVVTDAAAPLLAELGLVAEGDVAVDGRYVGSVEAFTDREHPLNANLRGVASQTYDTVPIGLAFPPNGENAPNWTVAQSAWETDGGFTAGTNGTMRTIYGEKPLGEGRVRFLGALLPQPTEAYYHPYGLQNYAVTYTGYTLLENMLVWDNPNRVGVDVRRVAGDTRIDTAIAFSREAFDDADHALLARADRSPDALAASTLAGSLDAPVLLTPSDAVPEGVLAELQRLGVGSVTLLGGGAAISTEVEESLRAEGYEVGRVAGATRFETAAAAADAVAAIEGPAPSALVAVGERPGDADPGPDAITAGVLGVATGQPVLLTRPGDLPAETAAAIQAAEGLQRVTVVGGTEAVSEAVADQLRELGVEVERIEGEDRYATSAAVADTAVEEGAGSEVVGLSGGDATADALVAGPALHHLGGASLLVDRAMLGASQATADWLLAHAPTLRTVLVAGGPAVVADGVLEEVRALLR
jgi:hypothetical protein